MGLTGLRGCVLLASGSWLLASGCGLLASGCGLLASGCWLLLAPWCPWCCNSIRFFFMTFCISCIWIARRFRVWISDAKAISIVSRSCAHTGTTGSRERCGQHERPATAGNQGGLKMGAHLYSSSVLINRFATQLILPQLGCISRVQPRACIIRPPQC